MALYKRPGSKYFWMKFTFDNQLVQRSTKCKARRDAETVESAYRTQLALGKVGIKPRKKPISFKQAADEYMAASGNAQKPSTIVRVKFLTAPLLKYFGSARIDQIEKSDVEGFIQNRSRQKSVKTGSTITNDTVNLELVALKTIFKRLISEGYISESPARDVPQMRSNELNFHVLTTEEERRYLMACPQPLQDVATIILETGMRPKEVYELKRQRVHLDKGFLQVVGAKTEAGNRKVWLSSRAAAVLRSRLERFTGDNLFPKGGIDHADPTHELNDQHRTAIKNLGVSFRIYDCRHTLATRLLEDGIDLITLAAILGHSKLDQLKRYAHPSESRKSEAIRHMEKRKQKAG